MTEFRTGRPFTWTMAAFVGLLALACAAILVDIGLPADLAWERRDPVREAFRTCFIFGLCVTAPLAVLLAWAAATPRPSLAVDQDGLHVLVLPYRPLERVPWDEVGEVAVSPLFGVPYLWIELLEPPDRTSDRSRSLRFVCWLNRIVGLPALSYVKGAFAAPLEEVRAALEQARPLRERLEPAAGGEAPPTDREPGPVVERGAEPGHEPA